MLSLEDYFRNSEQTAYRLSPDGKHVAFMAPYKDRMNIFVRPIDSDEVVQLTAETERSVAGYLWKGNDRIIFLKDSGGDENYHLFGLRIDGSELQCYTPFDGVRAGIIDDLENNPEEIMISLNQRNPECFDPYRLNIRTGEMVLLAENPGNYQGWTTDHDGKLRVVYAIVDGVNTQVLYRETEDEDFRVILTTNFKDEVNIVLFTPDNHDVYAVTNLGRDKAALVVMDPRTCEELEVLYQNDRYDVSSISYSRLRKRLLRAACNGHSRPVRHWFDEEERALFEYFEARFPGQRVGIADRDLSEQHMLLVVGSDRTRGAYWYYDQPTDTFTHIADLAPWITENDTVDMEPVTYTTSDGYTIEAYLSRLRGVEGPLPVIVNPHGGPWARDYWGYNSEVQFLCSRGYAVFQMNFRGSTGYGRKFLEASYKQWGLKMQDDITEGVKWLISEGIADPKRVAIYGGSYGGYATLAGICFTPELYRCAVDYVGVSNLLTFMNTIPPYWRPMLEMMYEQVGDPDADREQMEATSPALHADRIQCPLFIAQGANDPRVNKAESDQMVDALRARGIEVEYMVKDNEGHGFHNQENRFDFYRAMERFLAKNM
ncbi:MAG: S9 family peptidase [Bacteroidales bacterium]|nr:S9 family peptidase [Bacteroidales bacterium]